MEEKLIPEKNTGSFDKIPTSSINFCLDSRPFLAVFVNETDGGKYDK